MTVGMIQYTVEISGSEPMSTMSIKCGSVEHGAELTAALETTFGPERMLIGGAGKSIHITIAVSRIHEFWALVNELSRRCDFTINFIR